MKKSTLGSNAIMILMCGLIFSVAVVKNASAQSFPSGLNYQAYITDAAGIPVNDTLAVTFNAFSVDLGGTSLWSDTQDIGIDQGLLNVTLGNPVNPFPVSLFDTPVFIQISIEGEILLPRRALNAGAFAFKAADADGLAGLPASNYDQSVEIQTLENVTDEFDNRLSSLETSQGDITAVVAGTGLSGGSADGSATLSLAIGGVEAANMSFNAITGGAIQAGAVNSTKIEDGSIANIDLAANAVSSNNIVNGTVQGQDIALNTIVGAHITLGAVTASQLANGAVSGQKLQQGVVSSSKITDNTIASIDIANGAIAPVDIDNDAAYSMGGLHVQGDTQLEGPIVFNAGSGAGDVTIADNFSRFRWYNTAQTQELAAIEVGNTLTVKDVQHNRTVIHSSSSGIGIGTTTLSNTPVTMSSATINGAANVTGNATILGDVSIAGTLDVGYIQVTELIQATSTTFICSLLADCRIYAATPTCPTGFWPVGGGYRFHPESVNPNIRRNGLSETNPQAWECSYRGALEETPRGDCQVICLRVNGP